MSRAQTSSLSIVMPVGPGDMAWQACLPALLDRCAVEALDVSALLVLPAGMPTPPGLPAPVRVLHAPIGRASQLNAGARATASDWVWFVHADSLFGADALECVRRFMARDTDAIGYCDLAFAGDGPTLTRVNAMGAGLRSRVFGLPFGDQAFLVPRRVFERLGGFPDVVGEDHAFVWQARRRRIPVMPIGTRVCTSARRYATRGWLATTVRHLTLTALQAWRFSRGQPA